MSNSGLRLKREVQSWIPSQFPFGRRLEVSHNSFAELQGVSNLSSDEVIYIVCDRPSTETEIANDDSDNEGNIATHRYQPVGLLVQSQEDYELAQQYREFGGYCFAYAVAIHWRIQERS